MGRMVSDPKRLVTFEIGHPDDDGDDFAADSCCSAKLEEPDEKGPCAAYIIVPLFLVCDFSDFMKCVRHVAVPISASVVDDEKTPPALVDDSDDQICQAVGSFGRWQLKLTFLLSLVNIPCTWHIFVPTFQAVSPENFWCQRPPGLRDLTPAIWMNLSHPFSIDS
ncbi:hypothetical protein FOCC_FOCC002931, partial [Frankliniella occidentalis]